MVADAAKSRLRCQNDLADSFGVRFRVETPDISYHKSALHHFHSNGAGVQQTHAARANPGAAVQRILLLRDRGPVQEGYWGRHCAELQIGAEGNSPAAAHGNTAGGNVPQLRSGRLPRPHVQLLQSRVVSHLLDVDNREAQLHVCGRL